MELFREEKVFITTDQQNGINKLLKGAMEQGNDEKSVRGKILETHIKRGWKDIKDKEVSSLSNLTTEELATVLFTSSYEVKEDVLSLQEYEVIIEVNDYITLINKVSRKNQKKLSEEQVIQIALKHVNKLFTTGTEVSGSSVLECKTVKIEKE